MSLEKDPITNGIYNGIIRGIKNALEGECFGSALILIYSGIDAMAHLGMPKNQKEVKSADFIHWADKYIHIDSNEQISGEELYAARCAVLHTYGVKSRKTEDGSARKIGYGIGFDSPIKFDKKIDPDFLLLDIDALAKAFFEGVDKFLIGSFSDETKKDLMEKRANWILTTIAL